MWKKKSLVNRITLAIVFVSRLDFADNLVNNANENINVKTADLAPLYIEYYIGLRGAAVALIVGSQFFNSKVVDRCAISHAKNVRTLTG